MKVAKTVVGSTTNSYTFTYDALGRIDTAVDPNAITLTYGYNAANDRTSVSDSKNGVITSTYCMSSASRANRLVVEKTSSSGSVVQTIDYDYDVFGNLLQRNLTVGSTVTIARCGQSGGRV